ncbi:MAG: CBS domain-containing protein [Blastocatellia bacterium]
MKIREFMSQPGTVVREDTTLEEIARTLLEKNIGCVPVVDGRGKISGIVTESDFAAKEKGIPFSTFGAPQVLGQWMGSEGVERIYAAARMLTASAIMKTRVVTVTEDQSMDEAVELMLRHDINRIPVVRDSVPAGIVSRHDLLRLMVRKIAGGEKK